MINSLLLRNPLCPGFSRVVFAPGLNSNLLKRCGGGGLKASLGLKSTLAIFFSQDRPACSPDSSTTLLLVERSLFGGEFLDSLYHGCLIILNNTFMKPIADVAKLEHG